MESKLNISGWDIVRLTWMLQHHLFQSAQTELEGLNLTAKSISILGILEHIHHPSEIAKSISAPLPTVSNMLKELEQSGLVTRASSSKDRRMVSYHRTESGSLALAAGVGAINGKAENVLSTLTNEEVEELARILAKATGH